MRHAPYLQTRGSRFYFRMRIPPDLRAAIGVREFHLALKCPCKSRARRLAMSAGVEAHKLFERLRRMQTDPTAIQRAVRRYYDDVLQFDLAERTIAGNDSLEPEWMEEILEERTDMVRMLEQDLVRGRHHWVENTIQRLIDENGWSMTEGTLPHIELSFSVMRAFVEAQRRMLERDACKFDGEPDDSLLAEPVPSATGLQDVAPASPREDADHQDAAPRPQQPEAEGEDVPSAAMPLDTAPQDAAAPQADGAPGQTEAAAEPATGPTRSVADGQGARATAKGRDNEKYLEEKRKQTPSSLLEEMWKSRPNNRARTKKDYISSLRILDQVTGGKAIGEITEADIVRFKDVLAELPPRYSERFKTKDVFVAIERNNALPEDRRYPPLAPKTVYEKYLTNIRTFMKWARTKSLLTVDLTEVLANDFSQGQGPAVLQERLAFTPAQLTAIFSTPLFRSSANHTHVMTPGRVKVRDHRFWAPLLFLFTGARPGELGQLRVRDVVKEGNMWFFRFTTEYDPAVDGPEERKFKNKGAIRKVPVHPELERIGLHDYIRDLIRDGHTRLFPHWGVDSHGTYSGKIGKFFNRTLLKAADLKQPGLDFYSMRHTFKDILRDNGVDEEDRRIVLGHGPGDVHHTYGSKRTSRPLLDLWPELVVHGLDLSHISYR